MQTKSLHDVVFDYIFEVRSSEHVFSDDEIHMGMQKSNADVALVHDDDIAVALTVSAVLDSGAIILVLDESL